MVAIDETSSQLKTKRLFVIICIINQIIPYGNKTPRIFDNKFLLIRIFTHSIFESAFDNEFLPEI